MPEAKLSSPITLKNRALWFGKIQLHDDRIVISGWTWTGPIEEKIQLSEITSLEKWSVTEGQNFRLSRDGGAPVQGRIEKGAELWALEFEDDERVELKRRH